VQRGLGEIEARHLDDRLLWQTKQFGRGLDEVVEPR